MTEHYTPGHSDNATDFMARRSLHSHGQFFLPFLKQGIEVLDLGCGPGSITLDLAAAVSPAMVRGIDFGPSQIQKAQELAQKLHVPNVQFHLGSCYQLPFPNCHFDRVFAHAIME